MSDRLYNRDAGTGGFSDVGEGWYRISAKPTGSDTVGAELVKCDMFPDGTRYAIFRLPVLEPDERVMQTIPSELIGDVGALDAMELAISIVHPLDAVLPDAKGNLICRDFGYSAQQFTSMFGASISGMDLRQPEDALWENIRWLMVNGTRHDALLSIWENGWPSRSQVPPSKEVLLAFAGFQYYDYREGHVGWVLDAGRSTSDDQKSWRHLTPPLFRVVAPEPLAGKMLGYPFLNYTVAVRLVGESSEKFKTFGGGGPKARFPAFCQTLGVDVETLIYSHEDECMEIIEASEPGDVPWQILAWVEEAATEAADAGHILVASTTAKGFLDMSSLNVASRPVISRVAGAGGLQPFYLVTIAERSSGGREVDVPDVAVAEDVQPIVGKEIARASEKLGADLPAPSSGLLERVPVVDVVEAFNALSEVVGGKAVAVLDGDEAVFVMEGNRGRAFAQVYLLPLFAYKPLGLDRSLAFDMSAEAYSVLMQVCFEPRYKELAEASGGRLTGGIEELFAQVLVGLRSEDTEAAGGF